MITKTVVLLTWLFCAIQTAFTTKKDFGKGEREAQWAMAQRTLHGLQTVDSEGKGKDKASYHDHNELAEQAKKRAEIARYPIFHC